MSAICVSVSDQGVCTAADTLSMRADTRAPLCLTDKFIPMPHLNMILTATGYHGFLLDWYRVVMKRAAAEDIDHLNEFAPGLLKEAYYQFRDRMSLPDNPPGNGGTSIHHVGYSPRREEYVGYCYSSSEQFEPRRIGKGQPRFRPAFEGVTDHFDPDASLEENVITFFQAAKDHETRLGIGGEIHFAYMTKKKHVCKRIHRFDDYEETLEGIRQHNQRTDKKTLTT